MARRRLAVVVLLATGISGSLGQFNYATCGDKDGDGPGTEAVSDADCDSLGQERHGRSGYVARADSSDAVLAGAEWNPTEWGSDFTACCEQGWEACAYALDRGERCPEGMAMYEDTYYNGYDWVVCPEKPCNFTLGSPDVDVCCSEPVCDFRAVPGYVISTGNSWAYRGNASELSTQVECADGYTGVPNVTCSFSDWDYYSEVEYAEVTGCHATFSFATCGDKDGDGPGTEAVSDADCDSLGQERHGRSGYVARADSSDAVLAGAEWNPTEWGSDFTACCEQGWEACAYALDRGERCPEGMAMYEDTYYNGYDWVVCPEKPCNFTLGSPDVDVCCSEPVCDFRAVPGYVISTGNSWAYRGNASELSTQVECADGYTGVPNVTCSFSDWDYYSEVEYAEVTGCHATFSFATCGDKDGDGPGTEAVSDADCDSLGQERHGRSGYVARADSSDAVLAGAEWNPTEWGSDFTACCEQGWEACAYALDRGERCPEGMAMYEDTYYNGYDWVVCPEKPCNFTLGSPDVDVCCSEPVCDFRAVPGYVISTGNSWAYRGNASELSTQVECADGYTGVPNVTCSFSDWDYYSEVEYAEVTGCENRPPLSSTPAPQPGSPLSIAIDCGGVDANLPCNALLLVDELRDAASLQTIDKDIFCPCARVRAEHPEWSPAIVAGACPGGGR